MGIFRELGSLAADAVRSARSSYQQGRRRAELDAIEDEAREALRVVPVELGSAWRPTAPARSAAERFRGGETSDHLPRDAQTNEIRWDVFERVHLAGEVSIIAWAFTLRGEDPAVAQKEATAAALAWHGRAAQGHWARQQTPDTLRMLFGDDPPRWVLEARATE